MYLINTRCKSRFIFTLFVSMTLVTGSTLLSAETSVETDIIGAWKIYKDDDKPDGDFPDEVMSFWPDGKFRITAEPSYIGLYRIEDDELQLLVKLEKRALPVSRTFQLSGDELKFKNEKKGWAYYKRIDATPQGSPPDL